MKIGVSGASGHLGKAVVSELLQRLDGHEVLAILNGAPSKPIVEKASRAAAMMRVRVSALDAITRRARGAHSASTSFAGFRG